MANSARDLLQQEACLVARRLSLFRQQHRYAFATAKSPTSLYAAKADLHAKLGQNEKAQQCYQLAISMSSNDIEQAFLESRLEAD